MIKHPLNKLGQLLFGINDRRTARFLSREDAISVYYRGRYIAVIIESKQDYAKDKRFINEMLEALGFRGGRGAK